MPDILVYASKTCPYCLRARALLDKKGVHYSILDVDQNPELWHEIAQRTGRKTVPQIFIDTHHVGGCDDLFALEQRGALDPLLRR